MHVYYAIYPETGHFSWVPDLKWFVKAVGIEGIYKLTEAFQSTRATARTLIVYADEEGSLHFLKGLSLER